VIFAIFWIKAYTFPGYTLVFIYTIAITTFMFSRILGSFFYVSPAKGKKHLSYEPTVSFVIPCKNEEKAIYKTISTCFEVNYPKEKIEVIVINDGSNDNTLDEMLRAKKNYRDRSMTVVDWKTNRGKRHGMAEGFRLAKNEIIVQLDSDSYVEKNAIKIIVRPFVDKKVGAVVGHTDPANKDENIITKMQTAYYFMSFRALKATESIFNMVFCCSGCFSAYKKEYTLPVLNEWLKEKFLGRVVTFGDDRALTNQMLKRGYHAVYCDDALAYTIVPNNLKQFFKQQVRWKKGWFINSIKALKFIFKQDKFVSLTYFIPLIILTLLTPFIAFRALIYSPLVTGILPIFYIVGILLVSVLLFLHYKLHSNENYGVYMFLWSILNMTILSFILVYALYDLRNMKWGTR